MPIGYQARALKALDRLPRNVAMTIRAHIARLESDPDAQDVKRLKGGRDFRLRVGAWRVLFMKERGMIVVTDVLPRGSAYR